MLRYTPLYKEHFKARACFFDFSGWEMPLHYGSQINEHYQVRQNAGIFDVSHMGVVEIKGKDAASFLRFLLSNDIAKLRKPGYALYTCMLNDFGGVIDDLIVYCLSHSYYRCVINAATREKDVIWIKKRSRSYQVNVKECPEICIIAVQGPKVFCVAQKVFDCSTYDRLIRLKSFQFIMSDDLLIARTGYTGEDGIEIMVPNEQASSLWQRTVLSGAFPCGLAARDTLRLEAGLNLYGIDMDETTSPFSSNLGWTVSLEDPNRNFIGRTALENQLEQGIREQLVGLILEEPGVLRNHQKVWLNNGQKGEVTSGSFSPSLKRGIALARIPNGVFKSAFVEQRARKIQVSIVKPPFISRGKT